MRIAVVTEVSTLEKNHFVIEALAGREHEILNAGMRKDVDGPELTYIHTGLLSAILLNSGCADLVVGGCGTGQGYLNSVMQYPGISCGLIESPLDSWLFAQINGGNCLSLALNKGFGWAGDVNLRFIFDRFFEVEIGCGYPEHRRESQKKSRTTLMEISKMSHIPFDELLGKMDGEIINRVLTFPGVKEIVEKYSAPENVVRKALDERYEAL